MCSLAPALTLTLALSLNHLANKQLWSTNVLYSQINGSTMDYEQQHNFITQESINHLYLKYTDRAAS